MESLFTTATHHEQAKFIEELIYFRYMKIHNTHFRGFYGTGEQIGEIHKEIDTQLQRYINKLEKAFPDVPFEKTITF